MNPEQQPFHCINVRSQALKITFQAPKEAHPWGFTELPGRAPGSEESWVHEVAAKSDLGPWHHQPLVLRRWPTFLPTAQLQPGPCSTHELLDCYRRVAWILSISSVETVEILQQGDYRTST